MDERICEVKHRGKDERGRVVAHIGYIKRRTPEECSRYGGRPFAGFAIRLLDGVASGGAERFDTYDSADEAIGHARYAASRAEL